jgi:S-formylglutathione hydrolase
VLVACDTSPRGLGLPGEADAWDFGAGAAFCLDATQPPRAIQYHMGSCVDRELPAPIEARFPVQPGVRGILGHSMGGLGALVLALRDPSRWRSVSAFAPICLPMAVPRGEKAFSHSLGADRRTWEGWDASGPMRRRPRPGSVLVRQGLQHPFLESQLRPQALGEGAAESGPALRLARRPGYDHAYWFIQPHVGAHLEHRARQLGGPWPRRAARGP